MMFRTFRPRPPLSEFVDSFWFWQGDGAVEATSIRLPAGRLEFVISLRDTRFLIYDLTDLQKFNEFDGALVCGAQSKPSVTNSSESAIGVHFKPGGAFPFLRLPVGELRDQHVSLD